MRLPSEWVPVFLVVLAGCIVIRQEAPPPETAPPEDEWEEEPSGSHEPGGLGFDPLTADLPGAVTVEGNIENVIGDAGAPPTTSSNAPEPTKRRAPSSVAVERDPGKASSAAFRNTVGTFTGDAPKELGGFALGIDADATQSVCKNGGHEFASSGGDRATCSGAIGSLAVDAKATLEFCSGRLCRVHLVQRPESKDGRVWVQRFLQLRNRLNDNFGGGAVVRNRRELGCREDYHACLADGRAERHYRWRWSSGEVVHLITGTVKGFPGGPVVLLTLEKQ